MKSIHNIISILKLSYSPVGVVSGGRRGAGDAVVTVVAVRHGRPVTTGAVVSGPTAGRTAGRRRLGDAAQRRRLQQPVVGGRVERNGQRTRSRGVHVLSQQRQRRRHVKRGRRVRSQAARARAAEQLHLRPALVADVQHVQSGAQHVLHCGRGRYWRRR